MSDYGHKLDIRLPNFTLCYNSQKCGWVRLGGKLIASEKEAQAYAQKVSEAMV